MAGRRTEAQKRADAEKLRKETEDSQRRWRIENGVALDSDFKGTAGSFTKENARANAAKAAEARKQKREQREQTDQEKLDSLITEQDEAKAVRVLRKLMGSADEKVAQGAANKVLEYTKGRPTPKHDQPERIVFESAYVNPDLAGASGD